MRGSILLIFYNVKCFGTLQPFQQYTTAADFITKMNTQQTGPDL